MKCLYQEHSYLFLLWPSAVSQSLNISLLMLLMNSIGHLKICVVLNGLG